MRVVLNRINAKVGEQGPPSNAKGELRPGGGMDSANIALRAVLGRLTLPRTGDQPDGRPLYAYRFDRDDFELAREALKAAGACALTTLHGGALFVAFAAEWFRRDRTGGHWDWKRPLLEIGIVYGQDEPLAHVTYDEVRTAVENGLRWWRRPALTDGERILAIVKEAGFPAAAMRDNRRVADWLRNAVRLIERGFTAADAVRSEAWRLHADSIVQVTTAAAIELSEALVRLRAMIRERGDVAVDPIAMLDATEPDWRVRLPFELEAQDIAAVVETVLRSPLDRSSALFVTRRLRLSKGIWRATAAVGLTGELEQRRLPPSLARQLTSALRVRIVPRGDLAGRTNALAALERLGDDEQEAEAIWTLRPLLNGFEVPMDLDADVRLGAVAGDRLLDEFLAYAGEGLVSEVVVLEAAGAGGPDEIEELLVLGISPVRSKRPWLVLATSPETLERIRFDGTRSDLGRCADGRVLIAFSGTASLAADDGATIRWLTGSDTTETPRLVLVGPTIRQTRETVFRGLPRVWTEIGDVCREAPRQNLKWRPRGRGQWRPLGEGVPFGNIAIGVFSSGALVAFSGMTVVPPDFELVPSRSRTGLIVRGAEGARLLAQARRPLGISHEPDGDFVDLQGVEPGQTVTLTLSWDARTEITLCNPVTRQALIQPEGGQAPRHLALSIDRLHGYRLMTAERGRLVFELVTKSGRLRSFSRGVHGEAPLIAYLEDLRNLLGSSDSLDAAVRLSWIGGGDWLCEIKWYDLDPQPYENLDQTVFGASKLALLGIESVRALSIADPARGVTGVAATEIAALPQVLERAIGAGPWLIFGRTRTGQVLRPRTLASVARPSGMDSDLVAAVRTSRMDARARRLNEMAKSPSTWSMEDRRRLLDLAKLAATEGLPYAALDPLRMLAQHPGAAIWLLAFCETIEERSAVLAIQRDLSLLWGATPVELWVEAFEARAGFLVARMEEAGIDAAMAPSMIVAALSQILDLAPSLAVQVRSVLLVCVSAGSATSPATAAALADRLRRIYSDADEVDLAGRTNLFVQRHVDGPPPPSGLGLAAATHSARFLINRFAEVFADVIAAPLAAASGAFDRAGPDAATVSACREAWLFDPEHFESTTAAALVAWGATGPPRRLETTS